MSKRCTNQDGTATHRCNKCGALYCADCAEGLHQLKCGMCIGRATGIDYGEIIPLTEEGVRSC